MKLKACLKIVLGSTLILSTTLFSACDRDQQVEDEIIASDQEESADDAESVLTGLFPIAQSNVVVRNGNLGLSGSVVYHSRVANATLNTRSEVSPEVIDIPEEAVADGFSNVATIIPMLDEETNTLSSTCVQYFGNYAVISYHLHGEAAGGGLELLDISDPTHPVSISQIYIHNRDFNHIVFENEENISNSKFWALADDPKKESCYLIEGSLIEADFTSSLSEIKLHGASANNAVKVGGKLLIATSAPKARTGYFQVYDPQTQTLSSKEESMPAQRAKHIAVEGNSLVTLALENCTNDNTMSSSAKGTAVLRYYENFESFATPTATYELGEINPINGKNVVALKDGITYVALGKAGFKAINVSDGSLAGAYVAEKGIANGLAMDENNVYVAHGSGGIIVLDAQTLNYKYSLFTGYASSSNYISVDEDSKTLMIANGVSGTRILSTKVGPEPEPLCTSYIDLIQNRDGIYKDASSVFKSKNATMKAVFADGDLVPNYYEITEATDLYVTFTASTALSTNILGYFVTPKGQDINTYYQTVVKPQFKANKAINMNFVLFRSLSQSNKLYKTGDYATINNLKAGEKVVFFVIQSIGAEKGTIKFGEKSVILTTMKSLNSGDARYFKGTNYKGVSEDSKIPLSFKNRFNGTFFNTECNVIVTTFEDMHTSGADNDYSDVVFAVSDNAEGKVPSRFVMDQELVYVDSDGFMFND
ncbi:hypothetical protein LJB94_02300 [Odoribacter sp. OttesenSCG-928-G04]|nr:hypothetical protein [Odoribacter sp. OttesenSCG-928-G04]